MTAELDNQQPIDGEILPPARKPEGPTPIAPIDLGGLVMEEFGDPVREADIRTYVMGAVAGMKDANLTLSHIAATVADPMTGNPYMLLDRFKRVFRREIEVGAAGALVQVMGGLQVALEQGNAKKARASLDFLERRGGTAWHRPVKQVAVQQKGEVQHTHTLETALGKVSDLRGYIDGVGKELRLVKQRDAELAKAAGTGTPGRVAE